jgi:hypothetical protein
MRENGHLSEWSLYSRIRGIWPSHLGVILHAAGSVGDRLGIDISLQTSDMPGHEEWVGVQVKMAAELFGPAVAVEKAVFHLNKYYRSNVHLLLYGTEDSTSSVVTEWLNSTLHQSELVEYYEGHSLRADVFLSRIEKIVDKCDTLVGDAFSREFARKIRALLGDDFPFWPNPLGQRDRAARTLDRAEELIQRGK